MRSRGRRIRRSDAIGIVGLFLLLVWTPTFYAQEGAVRTGATPHEFTLPDPRPGDRISLDLVVQDGDATPERIRDILTITFDHAEPDSPGGAAYVERWVTRRANVSLSVGTYLANDLVREVFYDETGHVVWAHSSATQHFNPTRQLEEQGVAPQALAHAGTAYVGTQVRHQPVAAGILLESAVRKGFERLTGGIEQSDPVVSSKFAQVGDQRLFGAVPDDEVLEAFANDVDPRHEKTFSSRPSVLPFPGGLPGARMDIGDPIDVIDREIWTWFSPDAFLPVGGRALYHRESLPALTFDIVPGSLVRGTHASISLVPVPVEPSENSAAPAQRNGSPTVPTIPAGSLRTDSRPIYHNLSLATIWDLLTEPRAMNTSPTVASGALITEYTWQPLPHRIAGWNTPPEPLSPIHLVEPESVALTGRSGWLMTVVAPDEGARTLRFVVEERQNQFRFAAEPAWVCPDEDEDADCRRDQPSHVSPTTPFPDPLVLRTMSVPVRDATLPTPVQGVTISQERYAPLATCIPQPDDDCRRFILMPTFDPGGVWYPTYSVPMDGGTFETTWRDPAERKYVVLDLNAATGEARHLYRSTELTTPSRQALTRDSEHGTQLVLRDGIGPETAMLGGILVAIAVVARGLAALGPAGKAAPMAFLFSRIARHAALDHPHRVDLLAAIESEPGLTTQELSRRIGISRATTRHHLAMLAGRSLVVAEGNGQFAQYFVPDLSPLERRLLAVSRDDETARLLDALRAQPGQDVSSLATTLDRPLASVSRRVSRLARMGLVEKARAGRRVEVRLIEG